LPSLGIITTVVRIQSHYSAIFSNHYSTITVFIQKRYRRLFWVTTVRSVSARHQHNRIQTFQLFVLYATRHFSIESFSGQRNRCRLLREIWVSYSSFHFRSKILSRSTYKTTIPSQREDCVLSTQGKSSKL
jgi:hypothetical protein